MIDVVEQLPCAREHDARTHALDGGVPRPATADVGLLCGDCFRRLEYRLDDLPDIVQAARSEVVPGIVRPPTQPVSGSRERALPFDASAVEVADALFAALVNWATAVARTLEIDPPADLAGVFHADANANGMSAGTTSMQASALADRTVRWMVEHLEDVAELPMIVDLFDDIVPLVERAHGRWGDSGAKTRRRSRPCPACGSDVVRISWTGHVAAMWCRGCLLPLAVDWKALS